MSTDNSEKKEIIKQMLAMQKKFIAKEHSSGVEAEEYFAPREGAELDGYQSQYNALANRLLEIAHEQKGSCR